MKLRHEIVLFAVGGVLGFLIDAGIVQTLVRGVDWNPYAARVVSFLAAASVTWWWNRCFTFAARRRYRARREWLRWLMVMALGAAINWAVYVALLQTSDLVRAWPLLGVAAGSLAAALANFIGARAMVFGVAKSDS